VNGLHEASFWIDLLIKVGVVALIGLAAVALVYVGAVGVLWAISTGVKARRARRVGVEKPKVEVPAVGAIAEVSE
jgi:hypothetical protein